MCYLQLASVARPARLAQAGELLPQPVQALPAVGAAGRQPRPGHVAHLDVYQTVWTSEAGRADAAVAAHLCTEK